MIPHFPASNPNQEQDQARTLSFGHPRALTSLALLFLSNPIICAGGLLLFLLCSILKAKL